MPGLTFGRQVPSGWASQMSVRCAQLKRSSACTQSLDQSADPESTPVVALRLLAMFRHIVNAFFAGTKFAFA